MTAPTSNYPQEIDNFQTKENQAGTTYDDTDTQTYYAEDHNYTNEAIKNIETTLGENPQGDAESVAERFDALNLGLDYSLETSTQNVTVGYTETTVVDHPVTKTGRYLIFAFANITMSAGSYATADIQVGTNKLATSCVITDGKSATSKAYTTSWCIADLAYTTMHVWLRVKGGTSSTRMTVLQGARLLLIRLGDLPESA